MAIVDGATLLVRAWQYVIRLSSIRAHLTDRKATSEHGEAAHAVWSTGLSWARGGTSW